MPGLGFGVGLNQQQQQGFSRASRRGNLEQWLANHQGAANKLGGMGEQNATQQQRLTAHLSRNATAVNASGNPAAGAGGGKQGSPPAGGGNAPNVTNAAPPTGNPAMANANQKASTAKGGANSPVPPTYQDGLNAQFGQNNPFGQRQWYGDNPLETAQAVAQRNFDKNLADIRSRFAASGTGNSARQAIAEGTALGEFGTGLGDVLAQRGEGAFQNDATRGLQALMGAAGNQNQRDALALQLNQQLGGLGTGLTGVGAQEQGIPNLGEILGILTAFQSISGEGNNRSRGSSGFGFKN